MSANTVRILKERHASDLKEEWSDTILSIEEDGVWVSGINQNCGILARRIRQELEQYGYSTLEPRDEHGGLFVGISPER